MPAPPQRPYVTKSEEEKLSGTDDAVIDKRYDDICYRNEHGVIYHNAEDCEILHRKAIGSKYQL